MTSLPSSVTPALATSDEAPHRGWVGLYMELTKARLSLLVLMTTAVGFVMSSPKPFDWWLLLWTVLGTALSAGSAGAINQVIERRRDALMNRTRRRPLPSGAIGFAHGVVAASVMGVAGVAMLAALVNWQAASLSLATIIIYAAIYTPMKARSTLNTLIGAVCGALPPMIGWVAATGRLEVGAWLLGGILFVWQIPHFLALAWLYREDYQRGGFAMLPVIDATGRLTCQVIVVTSLTLLPLGLLLTILGIAGFFYALGSIVLGLWMVLLSLRLLASRTHANARGVFLASITYLPLLLCLLVIDRGSVAPTSRFQIIQAQVASEQPAR